jgi:protein TonB
MRRTTVALFRSISFAVLSVFLSLSAWAVSSPLCERLTLQELSPGMSHDQVRLKMGGGGIESITRQLDRRETSVANYPGPALEVMVEYDHRIDRRPTARAVLVRASMPLSPSDVEELVNRFGTPDVGADDLSDGSVDGIAIWVNEPCGIVLTAYPPRDSWWAAKGRTILQLETLDAAQRVDSPASSSLGAILDRQHRVPAAIPVPAAPAAAVEIPSPVPTPTPTPAKAIDEAPSPPAAPAVDSVAAPLPRQEAQKDVTSETKAAPLTIATWHPVVAAEAAPAPPPAAKPPAATHSVETLHPQGPAVVATAAPSDRPAERILFVPPIYPRTARWLGSKGHVTLAIVVKANGKVAGSPRVVAVDPPNQGFAESAIAAVHTWRFSPALRAGKPVKSTLTIDVAFE